MNFDAIERAYERAQELEHEAEQEREDGDAEAEAEAERGPVVATLQHVGALALVWALVVACFL